MSQEVDFAVAPQASSHEDIESLPFDKVEMIPVIAKSLAKQMPNLGYNSLCKFPQVIVFQSGDKGDLFKGDARGVLSDSKKCFVTDHNLKHKMILNGFGWGRLPRSEIQNELKKDVLVELKNEQVKPFTLDLHVMRLRHKPLGPVGKTVWEYLSKNALNKQTAKRRKN